VSTGGFLCRIVRSMATPGRRQGLACRLMSTGNSRAVSTVFATGTPPVAREPIRSDRRSTVVGQTQRCGVGRGRIGPARPAFRCARPPGHADVPRRRRCCAGRCSGLRQGRTRRPDPIASSLRIRTRSGSVRRRKGASGSTSPKPHSQLHRRGYQDALATLSTYGKPGVLTTGAIVKLRASGDT
jgi:hypothetical protein